MTLILRITLGMVAIACSGILADAQEAKPNQTAAFVVNPPGELHLLPGEETQFLVLVDRREKSGPVLLRLEGLPQGLTAKGVIVVEDSDRVLMRLAGKSELAPGKYSCKLVALLGDSSVELPLQLIVDRSTVASQPAAIPVPTKEPARRLPKGSLLMQVQPLAAEIARDDKVYLEIEIKNASNHEAAAPQELLSDGVSHDLGTVQTYLQCYDPGPNALAQAMPTASREGSLVAAGGNTAATRQATLAAGTVVATVRFLVRSATLSAGRYSYVVDFTPPPGYGAKQRKTIPFKIAP